MPRSPAPARAAVALAALTLVLAGCGGSDPSTEGSASADPSPTAAPTQTAAAPTEGTSTASPTASPTDEPTTSAAGGSDEADDADLPEPAETATSSPEFPDVTGPTSYLASVEIGDHPGYERVVFTFVEDAGVPSWQVEYVEEVREDGSGRLVEVEGAAALAVTLSGASGVDMSGETFEEVYTGPDRLDGTDAGVSSVQEVVETGDFEAVMSWAIGVDEQRPFRAFSLQDPARVVVDIATD